DDGIRDFHVTGVQTCALPIWALARRRDSAKNISVIEKRSFPKAVYPKCAYGAFARESTCSRYLEWPGRINRRWLLRSFWSLTDFIRKYTQFLRCTACYFFIGVDNRFIFIQKNREAMVTRIGNR